jgi:hypothetical protein
MDLSYNLRHVIGNDAYSNKIIETKPCVIKIRFYGYNIKG